jgi:hypothetical protein
MLGGTNIRAIKTEPFAAATAPNLSASSAGNRTSAESRRAGGLLRVEEHPASAPRPRQLEFASRTYDEYDERLRERVGEGRG